MRYSKLAAKLYKDGKAGLVRLEIKDERGRRTFTTALPPDLVKILEDAYDRCIRESNERWKAP